MNTESEDKQHQASTKRLLELRKKGTVLRSRELSSALAIIVGIGFILSQSTGWKQCLKENFIQAFHIIPYVIVNEETFFRFLKNLALYNFNNVLIVLILIFGAVLFSPFLFGGWNVSFEVIQFNFDKLNPIKNLAQIFSPTRMLLEIFKSAFKALFLLGILVLFFWANKTNFVNLIYKSPVYATQSAYLLVSNFILLILFSLIILILFDMLQHYFQFQRKTRMSSEEVKKEHKEAEGSIDIKRKIRSTQLQMMKQRITLMVPNSTVVITNPTHYAIALRYHETKDRAPKVVAKGKDHLALHIRLLAVSNSIPVYEAPSLARAIYHTSKLGQDIHSELYMAVAIVFSYIHQLKNYQMGIGQQPKYIRDFELPTEFIYE